MQQQPEHSHEKPSRRQEPDYSHEKPKLFLQLQPQQPFQNLAEQEFHGEQPEQPQSGSIRSSRSR